MNLSSSAIRNVSYYTATPVTSCDRCSTGIKNVFVVTYKDGEKQKFGSECINKILGGKDNLLSLFKKNSELLKKYLDYVAILTGPVEQMPRGREYFGSGKFFIADSKGKDIFFKSHWFFNPTMDVAKNHAGSRYVSKDPAEFSATAMKDLNRDVLALQAEIVRIEAFLAKILRAAPEAAQA